MQKSEVKMLASTKLGDVNDPAYLSLIYSKNLTFLNKNDLILLIAGYCRKAGYYRKLEITISKAPTEIIDSYLIDAKKILNFFLKNPKKLVYIFHESLPYSLLDLLSNFRVIVHDLRFSLNLRTVPTKAIIFKEKGEHFLSRTRECNIKYSVSTARMKQVFTLVLNYVVKENESKEKNFKKHFFYEPTKKLFIPYAGNTRLYNKFGKKVRELLDSHIEEISKIVPSTSENLKPLEEAFNLFLEVDFPLKGSKNNINDNDKIEPKLFI